NADRRMEPVAKASADKKAIGGRKWAVRQLSEAGVAVADKLGTGGTMPDDDQHRRLLQPWVERASRVDHDEREHRRDRLRAAMYELPADATKPSRGEPAIPTTFV